MLSIDLSGLEKLQRELEEAAAAFNNVEIELSFDADHASSVEVAMADADRFIDEIVGRYPSNDLVCQMGEECREGLRSMIIEHASTSRLAGGTKRMPDTSLAADQLEEIRETILELQSIDEQTMQRPFKCLSRLLKSEELVDVVNTLTNELDLDAWLAKGEATQGGFVGSASLEWPDSTDGELGFTILLIEKFAADPNFAVNFSFTFYYSGSNKVSSSLRKMTSALLIPFERKFSRLVRSKLGLPSSSNASGQPMNQFNFNNSTVGAVQTGDSSVANVTVQSTHNDNAQLVAALERLSAELAAIPSLPGHEKDEIVELVSDARAELAKERPSKAKLKAILPMVASAIGLVSDLGGAYTAVQLAATALGYPF
jgi:hypothetical protein